MIYLQSSGRLGNQMFRYAFARQMQIKRGGGEGEGVVIVMNFKPATDSSFSNQLQYFNITKDISFKYQKLSFFYTHTSLKQKIIYIVYRLLMLRLKQNYKAVSSIRDKITPFINKNGLYLQNIGFTPLSECDSPNILIAGSYESSKYFFNIKDLLYDEFKPIFNPLDKNRNLYAIINNTESICISIRRGDFLSPENKGMFNVCTRDYFLNAISKIKKICNNPVFIFFSDDINWCRNNFKSDTDKYYFESGDDPVWEKLRLMYSCKHFIISNSTFSWWAQFLGRYENKIVVSPARWWNIRGFDSPLLEDNFIKLNV
jgi:hypothetical protein